SLSLHDALPIYLFLLEERFEGGASGADFLSRRRGRARGDDAAAGGVEDGLRLEELAGVGGRLGGEALRDRLAALEAGARIEVHAVPAAMLRRAALPAQGVCRDTHQRRVPVAALVATPDQYRL